MANKKLNENVIENYLENKLSVIYKGQPEILKEFAKLPFLRAMFLKELVFFTNH